MRIVFGMAVASLMLALTTTLEAANISTLFNTGVTDGGAVRGNAQGETHYSLASQPSASSSSLQTVTSVGGFPVPPWLGDNTTSTWIRPDNSGTSDPDGLYKFKTTFDLSNYVLSSAVITGQWSTDNPGEMYLNGINLISTTGPTAFTSWTSFSLSNALLVSGVNTL